MLIALDQDPEFIAWDGSADDWHLKPPIKTHNYELDVDWVREQRVEVYLNDIERLPERMVKSTIGLYEKQIEESEPPLSDAAIAQLERKIQELEDYLDRLADRAGGQ